MYIKNPKNLVFDILIIDDEQGCHDIISLAVGKSSQYHLHHAYNGMEAMDLVHKFASRIKLILLDFSLEGHPDGAEIYKSLKNEPSLSQVKIILQTGYSISYIKQLHPDLEIVPTDILYKPYSINDLLETINKFCI